MTTPPTDIIFNGMLYRRYPQNASKSRQVYYQATNGARGFLHRDIWAHHHGRPVPPGHDVHHIDIDPFNNDPINLRAMPESDHHALHAALVVARPFVCAWCGKQSTTTAVQGAKYCHVNCKMAAHRAAGTAYVKPRKGPFREDRTCEHCERHYEARKSWQRFCDPRCKRAAYRDAATS